MMPPWCEQYIGLPFLDKGRTRAGVDCWGLVKMVAEEQFGIVVPDYSDTYDGAGVKDSVADAVVTGIMRHWRPAAEAKPGTVAVLRVGGKPWHCAIVVADGWMLHVMAGHQTVGERMDSMVWKNRIEGVYEYVGA